MVAESGIDGVAPIPPMEQKEDDQEVSDTKVTQDSKEQLELKIKAADDGVIVDTDQTAEADNMPEPEKDAYEKAPLAGDEIKAADEQDHGTQENHGELIQGREGELQTSISDTKETGSKRKFADVGSEDFQVKRHEVAQDETNIPNSNNVDQGLGDPQISQPAELTPVTAFSQQDYNAVATEGQAHVEMSFNSVTGEVTAIVDCPANVIGRIIGKSGDTINSLQSRTGARVQIDQSGPVHAGNVRKVTVSGLQTAVQAAVSNIQDLIALGVTPQQTNVPASSDSDITTTIECAPTLVGRLIGRQGETIKAMQAQSGAFIAIDQNFPDGVNRVVTVRGSAKSVDAAKVLIYDLMSGSASGLPIPSANTKVIDVQQGIVGRIIGRGGETIKKLQQMSGARIQIDQQNWKITVSGPDNAVNTAVGWVHEIINGGHPFHQAQPQGMMGMQAYGYQQAYQQPYQQQGYYQQGGMMGGDQGQYQQQAVQQMHQMYQMQTSGMGYGAMAQNQFGGVNGSGLPAGWTEAQDQEGRSYYVNLTTGISQWERPSQ